jgi:tetratricopeptide (TPR) repeat protein
MVTFLSAEIGRKQKNREIKLLKAALEKDLNDLPTLIDLGNAYFDTDQYPEAIDAYSKALAIDPKNPDVRTDMGIMYRRLGQVDKAIQAFRQAAQDQPMRCIPTVDSIWGLS